MPPGAGAVRHRQEDHQPAEADQRQPGHRHDLPADCAGPLDAFEQAGTELSYRAKEEAEPSSVRSSVSSSSAAVSAGSAVGAERARAGDRLDAALVLLVRDQVDGLPADERPVLRSRA